jgi:glycosyltransferase involved in cell wall biosynthesis
MIQAVDIVNFGLDICKGQWITKLDDDDELVPEHIELLLNAAIEQNVDYIYGRTMVYDTNNNYYGILGHWPPEVGGMGVGLWKSSLKYRYNPKSWEKDLPADWELITQLLSDNIKIGYLHKATYKYYPILAIPKCEVE